MTPTSTLLARRLAAAHRDIARADPARQLHLRPGDLADYRALARYHYRAGDPSPGSRVLTLRDAHAGGQVVAVLVVSRPVLNAGWRQAAWPGRFATPDPRENARRVNRDLRVISRVIVDPRWRALGLGARLVRAYLRQPDTRFTEALAAMAGACPFFQRAGMTPIPVPPSRRQRALLKALAAHSVSPFALAAPWSIPPRLRRRLAPAIRAWAKDSRATSRLASRPLAQLMPLAAASLAMPLAFVHDRDARSTSRRIR